VFQKNETDLLPVCPILPMNLPSPEEKLPFPRLLIERIHHQIHPQKATLDVTGAVVDGKLLSTNLLNKQRAMKVFQCTAEINKLFT
jgi:hypothetical protein